MWVKPDWDAGSHSGANLCLAGERTASDTRFSLHFGNDLTSIGIWNGRSYNALPHTFTKGQWYHIAFVMTTSDTEIFVNGASIGTTGNGINTAVTGANLCFGAANSSSTTELFEGELDEIRVWNTARTAAQISENMNTAISATTAGLLDYYPIDQDVLGAGNVGVYALKDYTSGYNGTLYNFRYAGAPALTSFTPDSGPAGTSVVLTGTNFTGATDVSFNGVAAASYTRLAYPDYRYSAGGRYYGFDCGNGAGGYGYLASILYGR